MEFTCRPLTDATLWPGANARRRTSHRNIGTPYGAGTPATAFATSAPTSGSSTFQDLTPKAKNPRVLGNSRRRPRPRGGRARRCDRRTRKATSNNARADLSRSRGLGSRNMAGRPQKPPHYPTPDGLWKMRGKRQVTLPSADAHDRADACHQCGEESMAEDGEKAVQAMELAGNLLAYGKAIDEGPRSSNSVDFQSGQRLRGVYWAAGAQEHDRGYRGSRCGDCAAG
jgi:hypothetical protein